MSTYQDVLTILAAADDNPWFGSANGDLFIGTAPAELLIGGGGDDRIYGGGGTDFMSGNFGNDRLYGGTGNDVFSFTAEDVNPSGLWTDQILDFHSGGDIIVFNNHATYGFGDIDIDDLNIVDEGAGVWSITVDGFSGFELLVDVTGQGDLYASDIVFGGA